MLSLTTMPSIQISSTAFTLVPGELSLQQLRQIWREGRQIELSPIACEQIKQSRLVLQQQIEQGVAIYGVNSGLGLGGSGSHLPLSQTHWQQQMIQSCQGASGAVLNTSHARLVMVLKVNALSQGFSGVRLELIHGLVGLINKGIYPCLNTSGGNTGSAMVGLAAALTGTGYVYVDNQQVNASEALLKAGITPFELAEGEVLSLLCGTEYSTACILTGLFALENLFAGSIVTGAMDIDAVMASRVPFSACIHTVRRHQGQIDTAAAFRALLQHSQIEAAHINCSRLHDPHPLRCQPQILGACLEQLRFVARWVVNEANAVTDNPLIFHDTEQILSGGNFHTQPMLLAADALFSVFCHLGVLSRQRLGLLLDPVVSGLPANLSIPDAGYSGFMTALSSASVLAEESRALTAGVMMNGAFTGSSSEDISPCSDMICRRLRILTDNCASIQGMELMAAIQGVRLRSPLKTSLPLREVMKQIKVQVLTGKYRYFAADLGLYMNLMHSEFFLQWMPEGLLPADESQKQADC